jgi:quercetin dioxygenase-like cupin family protein
MNWKHWIICLICVGPVWAEDATSLEAPRVVSETLAKSTMSWDGAVLPEYPEGQPEITILRITIPGGMKLALHSHPVINAGVLTKGQLVVTKDNGEQKLIEAGEALIEVVNTWHYGANPGDTPAEIIVFYAGAVGVPVTVFPADE